MFFCEEESPSAGMLSSFTACRISSSISVVICTSATLLPPEIDFSMLVTWAESHRQNHSIQRQSRCKKASESRRQNHSIRCRVVETEMVQNRVVRLRQAAMMRERASSSLVRDGSLELCPDGYDE
jgi:hypothetical protein